MFYYDFSEFSYIILSLPLWRNVRSSMSAFLIPSPSTGASYMIFHLLRVSTPHPLAAYHGIIYVYSIFQIWYHPPSPQAHRMFISDAVLISSPIESGTMHDLLIYQYSFPTSVHPAWGILFYGAGFVSCPVRLRLIVSPKECSSYSVRPALFLLAHMHFIICARYLVLTAFNSGTACVSLRLWYSIPSFSIRGTTYVILHTTV
jgi:hypothetical protein